MARRPLGGPTIKAALSFGFTLTLGLWLAIGYRFAQDVAAVEEQSAAIASRYVQAQEQLSLLRSTALAASGTVRSALFEGSAAIDAPYRDQLETQLTTLDVAVKTYSPVLDSPEERHRLTNLKNEADRFASAMRAVPMPSPSRSATGIFNSDVLPRRSDLLNATEEFQAQNRAAFVRHHFDLATRHGVAERRTWVRLGLALIVSLGIAALATLYGGRLERRLRSQLQADAVKTRALQDLSIKIIRAQEDERRRISHELHDEVGQALTALKVEISLAQRALRGMGAADDLLQPAQAITDRALHTVRDLSHLLHPAVLDDLGLPDAVDGYVRDFSKRFGIATELHVHGMAVRLPPDIEVAAYRMIQEALTNVAKHARATRCDVTLHRYDDRFEILVQDDGAGFDPSNLAKWDGQKGLGLIGMRERALQLAGVVTLDSAPGRGTALRIVLSTERPAMERALPLGTEPSTAARLS
jgi:signal transduction histidine kinase